ncbi:MAG: hypothetical protein Q8N02_08735 [Methylotenera sp.]|nr:hypothetical protein [Methylotenera sp.]MDO9232505.1 hypothetical protein [Methylotenera sp.]MDO9388762.1 hypothetical protein [Methylotenera sp.]MDP2403526.1 hypothetical protein [Methylotenera sp.]MDP3095649.1 hypothetical protein [Methylotenera sp.]
MADMKHIIEPERFGLWIAATFVIALLALVVAFVGIKRSDDLMYMTQTQVLLLNKKIETANPSAKAPVIPAQQEQE